jgi:predicted ATP-binding protein involved in virulence
MIQLMNVILFNEKGETRNLKFKPNSINIITGKSKTGKTAIIDIIEYCFGNSKFKIPPGIIEDSVSWYLVKYKINDF